MSLTAGRQILHYRLDTALGQGGMGVVWRAHDTSLGRDAALKFLPDLLAADPERMARLEREARLLAALNHPRIASIYGFHQEGGQRFLAMELVEGEDLAQRLARAPIPVAEALPLALQIAEALEHAHEKGVIHRDLKPANVKLDASGGAKVLDFGLAKAIEGDPATAHSGSAFSHSPTITGGMTAANVLLGTAAYMSPEQARGQVADRRADIWAFGVLLFEMLTSRRLFEGETISDTLAAVLRSDLDYSKLPADTPPRVRALLRRCLERDSKRRLRDIGEARIVLEETLRGVPDESLAGASASPAPVGGRSWWPVAGALVLGAIIALVAVRVFAPRAEAPLRKFQVEADTSAATLASAMISPDGRLVACIVGGHVTVRDLARFELRSYPVEQNALALFWSPDSRELGYFTGTRVARLSASDGQVQVLSDTRAEFSGGSGGFWSPRGFIVFSRGDSMGVFEISERGGDPRVVMPADLKRESDVHDPIELPGGRGIVFVSHTLGGGLDEIWLWSKGRRRMLIRSEGQTLARPRYSPSGHLLYQRTPNTPGIWAVPFSLARLQTTGEPFLVAAEAVFPSVSLDGTLCYRPGRAGGTSELVWLDRQTGVARVVGEPAQRGGYTVALDPLGTRIARAKFEVTSTDLWIYDDTRSTRTRLTFDPGEEDMPDWSPDGRTIVYSARQPNCSTADCWSVVRRSSDGAGRVDTLARSAALPAFTPDGRDVIYTALNNRGATWDVVREAADGSGTPVVLVRGRLRAFAGRVSPDGSLLAYVSNESERYEVYLTRYPGLEGRWQVSSSGGQWPLWSPKGDRLYYCRGDDVLEVAVGAGASPTLGNSRMVLARPHAGPFAFGLDMGFVVSRDGRRVLTARDTQASSHAAGLAIVQNWASEFRGKK